MLYWCWAVVTYVGLGSKKSILTVVDQSQLPFIHVGISVYLLRKVLTNSSILHWEHHG